MLTWIYQAVWGAETDDAGWEKALRQAMRSPFVVQEVVEQAHAVFPLLQYGSLMMKDMVTHVHPHAFAGSVHGASCWLGVAGATGFSITTIADFFYGSNDVQSPIQPKVSVDLASILAPLDMASRRLVTQQLQALQLLQRRPVMLVSPLVVTIR